MEALDDLPDLFKVVFANEIKSTKGDLKRSVTLFDIDYAMMSYLEDTVLPTLKDANGAGVKIPVIYGNSERWNGARRQGVYRDGKGKIQLPIMMLRSAWQQKSMIHPISTFVGSISILFMPDNLSSCSSV